MKWMLRQVSAQLGDLMRFSIVSLCCLALLGCKNEGTLINATPDVSVVIESPVYGEFLGDGPVEIRGVVSPPGAALVVEGVAVEPNADGSFAATVEFEDAFRIIDAQAELRGVTDRARLPVFRGLAPMDTWPESAILQLTPSGLDAIGRGMGGLIDQTGWDEQLASALPSFDLGFVTVTPTGIDHDPTVLALVPHDGGIDMYITLVNVSLVTEVAFDLGGGPIAIPATFTYSEVAIGALATPGIDDQGQITLTLSDADITFGEPTIDIAGIPGLPLDFLLSGLGALIEPLGEALLDPLLGSFDGLVLGGPFDFETDLFGTTLAVALADLATDDNGLAIELGMGIDGPAPMGPVAIERPAETNPDVHVALGVHGALLDRALSEQVLGLVTQELDLGGVFGNVIGIGILALPGGDDAPDSEDGWCLSVNPGTAHVVRAQNSVAPLATLYMPDVIVNVGIKDGDDCEEWLSASLAMNVNINVTNGTAIGIGFAVPEGAVLSYGADPDSWTEEEVVEGLGGFLVNSIGLLAGNLSFDLADILGGDLLGGIGIPGLEGLAFEPQLISSTPLLDEAGEPVEGQFSLGIQLFANE